jgi:4-amino-4-deoxy-L-arabinose transferase-like glycosyltransferase
MTPGIVSIVVLVGDLLLRKTPVHKPVPERPSFEPASRGIWMVTGLIALPFLILLLLNGFTPPWEFDVREYHLQGPKEWFQAGQITFLEHNVYTSFPFLSEMLSLNAMVLADDWNDGAIAGKIVLAGFQLLTTLCVFATGRRWFGTSAGLIAALVYLTVPWTLRISLIAYAEGAITFFLMATAMSGLIASAESHSSLRYRLTLTTGLLAGSAMAAKYPGVLSVVIPTGLLLLWSLRSQRRLLLPTALLFGAGVLLTVGPWLIRNVIDTGNPVYPLMSSVLGADDWSPAMDVKWKNAHSAPDHNPARIPEDLLSVLVFSDWTSGLLFGLAIPTLLLLKHHREARWLWLLVLWILATWWALTHRIDRFWIPIIPVAAVLAGASWTMFHSTSWRTLLLFCVASCSLFNLQLWRIPFLTGMQAGLMDMKAVRSVVVRNDIRILNKELSPDDRILMVGEAEVFDLHIPVFYNTVFDESLFEQWTADESDDRHWSAERQMKSTSDIHDILKDKGITHIYVNWLEILRYHESYGYTEYVTPQRLKQLVLADVLAEATILGRNTWEELETKKRKLIEDWPGYEDLLIKRTLGEGYVWEPLRLYKVR